jgi:hypothetical protein
MEGEPRHTVAGWAIAVAIAAMPACGLALVTSLAGADESAPASDQVVVRTCVLDRLTHVDLATGVVREVAVSQLGPDDLPFELAARRGAVVFADRSSAEGP